MTGEQGSRYDLLVRDCYRSGGYVYAPRLHDITGNRGTIRIARLASNENPDPPSPRAIERGEAAFRGANRYPGDEVTEVGQGIAGLSRPLPFRHGGRDGWRHRDGPQGLRDCGGPSRNIHSYFLFLWYSSDRTGSGCHHRTERV